MTATTIEPTIAPTTEATKPPPARVQHIVELGPDGQYLDKCLCGYVWDSLHRVTGGPMCTDCVKELRRRQGKQ